MKMVYFGHADVPNKYIGVSSDFTTILTSDPKRNRRVAANVGQAVQLAMTPYDGVRIWLTYRDAMRRSDGAIFLRKEGDRIFALFEDGSQYVGTGAVGDLLALAKNRVDFSFEVDGEVRVNYALMNTTQRERAIDESMTERDHQFIPVAGSAPEFVELNDDVRTHIRNAGEIALIRHQDGLYEFVFKSGYVLGPIKASHEEIDELNPNRAPVVDEALTSLQVVKSGALTEIDNSIFPGGYVMTLGQLVAAVSVGTLVGVILS